MNLQVGTVFVALQHVSDQTLHKILLPALKCLNYFVVSSKKSHCYHMPVISNTINMETPTSACTSLLTPPEPPSLLPRNSAAAIHLGSSSLEGKPKEGVFREVAD